MFAVCIFEPTVFRAADASIFHFDSQRYAAEAMKATLRTNGSDLLLHVGEVLATFEQIIIHTHFDAIYAHEEVGTNLTFARDRSVIAWCQSRGIEYKEFPQSGVVRGRVTREQRNQISAARLRVRPLQVPELPPVPATLRRGADAAHNYEFDSLRNQVWRPGAQSKVTRLPTEKSAREDLRSFLKVRSEQYLKGISSPNLAMVTGSRLSGHLAWGTLSCGTVHSALQLRSQQLRQRPSPRNALWRKMLDAFRSRLFWRDHFMQRFESATWMEHAALNPAYEDLKSPDDGKNLRRLMDGDTGIPLVDACIRCLRTTGFINFRMRAMLVSVACYGFGIHWRDLQYPLARLFYDYEPGIHFSQVQMQAGVVGINTLRVYNPDKQLIDQDEKCIFVKKWVEELRETPVYRIVHHARDPVSGYSRPPSDFLARAKERRSQITRVKRSIEARAPTKIVLDKHGSRRSRPQSSRQLRFDM